MAARAETWSTSRSVVNFTQHVDHLGIHDRAYWNADLFVDMFIEIRC